MQFSPLGRRILTCSNKKRSGGVFSLVGAQHAASLLSENSAECHSERSEDRSLAARFLRGESAFGIFALKAYEAFLLRRILRKLSDEVMSDFLSRRMFLQFAESACPPS